MFQYFPAEDVAIASVDGRVFLLSRSPKSGSFLAVSSGGSDLTQPAVEAGLLQTFLEAADSALTTCVLQTMDRDIYYDPESSGLISALTLMGGDMDEDELFEEKDRLDSAGLLGSAEYLYDELCREESVLSEAGLAEIEYQGPAVQIDLGIPDAEKWAFVRDLVAARHALVEKPLVEEPTHDALFSRVDLAAWGRVLQMLEIYPRGANTHYCRQRPFHAWPVRRVHVHATPAENVCGPSFGTMSVSWETLKTAVARCLGPEEFASEEAYARARRAAADVAGRAVETTSNLLGKLRAK
jgi:hypothetical protein